MQENNQNVKCLAFHEKKKTQCDFIKQLTLFFRIPVPLLSHHTFDLILGHLENISPSRERHGHRFNKFLYDYYIKVLVFKMTISTIKL